jgi:hypothetical protein
MHSPTVEREPHGSIVAISYSWEPLTTSQTPQREIWQISLHSRGSPDRSYRFSVPIVNALRGKFTDAVESDHSGKSWQAYPENVVVGGY